MSEGHERKHYDSHGGPAAETITISPQNVVLTEGDTRQMTATVLWSGGLSQDITLSATWSSSDGTIATVDASGLVTAVGAGAATISARLGRVLGGASVSVLSSGGNNNEWYYPLSIR